MRPFDKFVVVDWSASSKPSPVRPSADAIWIGTADADGGAESRYYRTRAAAMQDLRERLLAWRLEGKRVFLGVDFPLGYPQGFAGAVTGRADTMALWDVLAGWVQDGPDNANNRFAVATSLNNIFPGVGPFWGGPEAATGPALPAKGSERTCQGLPERRLTEDRVPSAQSCWKLYTVGSVGSQALLGITRMAALRRELSWNLSVWPFEAGVDAPVVLAEIYPSLIHDAVTEALASTEGAIKDDLQVRLLAQAFAQMQRDGQFADLFAAPPEDLRVREEGWILGVGAEDALTMAARVALHPELAPPRLKNDCFALPPGVDWTPVDAALASLQAALAPVAHTEEASLSGALGRMLAEDVSARRSNPPGANTAVDGYGFAGATLGSGRQILPLVAGRAAAGAPYRGTVPAGHAIRILTGALLPEGVDTVVLEEDCAVTDTHVSFDGPVKPRANTRNAGEDAKAGDRILPAGRRLGPPELALLAATGVTRARLYRPLRVGVVSTGDEIVPAGTDMDPGKTFDANRPMLLGLAAKWGYVPVDLGHVADDRAALRRALNRAAKEADVVLTSGGASAGDEDHVSALLREEGVLNNWRIAVKPGRPLALALWDGVPVFGLPGNSVAAFVCSLIFARPALAALSGQGWSNPQGFTVPAAFSKSKKPGRREYLRARLTSDGAAEVFPSEGSGRVSGLSWATGLVELEDGGRKIAPGDPVRFLPYGSFGL